MNPDDNQHGNKFRQINTSLCEQFFLFLTKFRFALRGFNYLTSTLFLLLLFHLKNCHTTGIKANDFGLGRKYFHNKIQEHVINPCIFENVAFDINEKQRNYQWEESEQNAQVWRCSEEYPNYNAKTLLDKLVFYRMFHKYSLGCTELKPNKKYRIMLDFSRLSSDFSAPKSNL